MVVLFTIFCLLAPAHEFCLSLCVWKVCRLSFCYEISMLISFIWKVIHSAEEKKWRRNASRFSWNVSFLFFIIFCHFLLIMNKDFHFKIISQLFCYLFFWCLAYHIKKRKLIFWGKHRWQTFFSCVYMILIKFFSI